MSVVYLVRHGQASFGQADYDVLSPVGERQARVVGEELAARGVRPAAVLSGSLLRQRRTAEIAVAAAGLDVEVAEDVRWNEYDHIGLVADFVDPPPTDPREFQSALDKALLSWARGEPAAIAGAFADFAAAGAAAMAAAADGGTAVVFTSGGVVAALCAGLLGLGPDGVVALNRVAVNAAITKVVIGRSGSTLVSFNEHGHFEGSRRDLLTYR